MYEKFGQYIDGKWQGSSDNATYDVINPATEEVIGKISAANKNDIDLAVEAAKLAYESRVLVDMNPMERAKLMRSIADELRKISKDGGALLCEENGKLLAASEYEFLDAANYFDYYSGLTDKIEGQTIPVNNQAVSYTHLTLPTTYGV